MKESDESKAQSHGFKRNVQYHLKQFIKGVFISGLTFGVYGLLKRAWGESSTAKSEAKSSHDESSIIKRDVENQSDLTVDIISSNEATAVMGSKLSALPVMQENLSVDVAKKETVSIADALGISYHDQQEDNESNINSPRKVTFSPVEQSDLSTLIINEGEEFRLKIPGYTENNSGKSSYFGDLLAMQVGGSSLPSWLKMSNPSVPLPLPMIGNYLFPSFSYAEDVKVQGNIAFVASLYSGLLIFNVSEPQNPALIYTIEPTKCFVGQYLAPAMPDSIFIKDKMVFFTEVGLCEVDGKTIIRSKLNILDTTKPRYPVIGSYESLSFFNALNMQNDLAFIVDGYGFQIVNVSTPAVPVQVGNITISGDATAVAVKEKVVYVSTLQMGYGVKIVDISNPKIPRIVGNISNPDSSTVAVQNDLLFLGSKKKLSIFNISKPLQPRKISSTEILFDVKTITVQGNLLLVADSLAGIKIFDVTKPKAPKMIGDTVTPGAVNAVIAQENFLFVADDYMGFEIYSMDPWYWELAGTPLKNDRGRWPLRIKAVGNLDSLQYQKEINLFVNGRPDIIHPIRNFTLTPTQKAVYRFETDTFLDPEGELLFFHPEDFMLLNGVNMPKEVNILRSPVIGQYNSDGYASSIVVNKNLVFMTDGFKGVLIVDIATPDHPKVLNSISSKWSFNKIAIQENLAFVVDGNTLLTIIDIKNTGNAKIIAKFEFPLSATINNYVVQNDLLYVACGNIGLQIVNISTPQAPKIVDGYQPGSWNKITAFSIEISNNLVFLGGENQLLIIDVSKPITPGLLSRLNITSASIINSIKSKNNFVFVADSKGMQIVDAVVPTMPSLVKEIPMSSGAGKILLKNNLAYVNTIRKGLFIFDIKEPGKSCLIDTVYVGYSTEDIDVHENLVFVAEGNDGLKIVDLSLGGWVFSIATSQTTHVKYQLGVKAHDSYGAMTTATFWVTVNQPPLWKNMIPLQQLTVAQISSFSLPPFAFIDPDNDPLSYTSELSNGERLPLWLTFSADPYRQNYVGFPQSNNRGLYNVSVKVDDGYFAQSQAWFLINVPNRPPVKKDDVPTQIAFIGRAFNYEVPSYIFSDPDGDTLSYTAMLKGNLSLPGWLSFDPLTSEFTGTASLIPWEGYDLNIELIASDGTDRATADFKINVSTKKVFEDLGTAYAASGGALVLFALIFQYWRSYKMKQIKDRLEEIIQQYKGEMETLNSRTIGSQLTELQELIKNRNHKDVLEQAKMCSILFSEDVKNKKLFSILDAGNLLSIIDSIASILEDNMLRKVHYKQESYESETLWAQALNILLHSIVISETRRKHPISKMAKEQLVGQLGKIKSYIDIKKPHAVRLFQLIEMNQQAMVLIYDTSLISNFYKCRNFEVPVEFIKIMIAPIPFGVERLYFHWKNIPGTWYLQIVELRQKVQEIENCLVPLETKVESKGDSKAQGSPERSQKAEDDIIEEIRLIFRPVRNKKDWRLIYEEVAMLVVLMEKAAGTKRDNVRTETFNILQRYNSLFSNLEERYACLKRAATCFGCRKDWAAIHEQIQAESSKVLSDYRSLNNSVSAYVSDSKGKELEMVSIRDMRQPLLHSGRRTGKVKADRGDKKNESKDKSSIELGFR